MYMLIYLPTAYARKFPTKGSAERCLGFRLSGFVWDHIECRLIKNPPKELFEIYKILEPTTTKYKKIRTECSKCNQSMKRWVTDSNEQHRHFCSWECYNQSMQQVP